MATDGETWVTLKSISVVLEGICAQTLNCREQHGHW